MYNNNNQKQYMTDSYVNLERKHREQQGWFIFYSNITRLVDLCSLHDSCCQHAKNNPSLVKTCIVPLANTTSISPPIVHLAMCLEKMKINKYTNSTNRTFSKGMTDTDALVVCLLMVEAESVVKKQRTDRRRHDRPKSYFYQEADNRDDGEEEEETVERNKQKNKNYYKVFVRQTKMLSDSSVRTKSFLRDMNKMKKDVRVAINKATFSRIKSTETFATDDVSTPASDVLCATLSQDEMLSDIMAFDIMTSRKQDSLQWDNKITDNLLRLHTVLGFSSWESMLKHFNLFQLNMVLAGLLCIDMRCKKKFISMLTSQELPCTCAARCSNGYAEFGETCFMLRSVYSVCPRCYDLSEFKTRKLTNSRVSRTWINEVKCCSVDSCTKKEKGLLHGCYFSSSASPSVDVYFKHDMYCSYAKCVVEEERPNAAKPNNQGIKLHVWGMCMNPDNRLCVETFHTESVQSLSMKTFESCYKCRTTVRKDKKYNHTCAQLFIKHTTQLALKLERPQLCAGCYVYLFCRHRNVMSALLYHAVLFQ